MFRKSQHSLQVPHQLGSKANSKEHTQSHGTTLDWLRSLSSWLSTVVTNPEKHQRRNTRAKPWPFAFAPYSEQVLSQRCKIFYTTAKDDRETFLTTSYALTVETMAAVNLKFLTEVDQVGSKSSCVHKLLLSYTYS